MNSYQYPKNEAKRIHLFLPCSTPVILPVIAQNVNQRNNGFLYPILAVRMIGPVLPEPPQPLPADLEKFMQSSGEHGVILVTFGSMVSKLDPSILKKMTHVFGRLKQKILWKVKSKFDLNFKYFFGWFKSFLWRIKVANKFGTKDASGSHVG